MTLDDLHILAFRAFEDVRFEGMGRMSLVVGANNAGKSSVLEAAGLALRPFDPGQWVQAAVNRDLSASLVPSLWSLFPGASVLRLQQGAEESRKLMLDATVRSGPRSVEVEATVFEGWSDSGEAEPVLTLTVGITDAESGVMGHVMEFRRGAAVARGRGPQPYRVFTVTPATHRSTKVLVAQLSDVVNLGKKDLALDLLRLFDAGVQDIEVTQVYGRDGISVTHEERGIVELSSFGDGMRRSAALALALTIAEGGLVLVDELEGGIHPRALRRLTSKLLDAAKRANVQILATTQSLEAIDAVLEAIEPDSVDDLVGYHIRREGKQHHVRRFDGKRLASLRKGGSTFDDPASLPGHRGGS